jgi:sulfite exporter TauE/SafE
LKTFEGSLGTAFPISVFVASLVGSFHCFGMCGALSCLATQGGRMLSSLTYHGGRLVGYLSLGGLAGLFGKSLLGGNAQNTLSIGASLLIALSLFVTGIAMWQNKSLGLNRFVHGKHMAQFFVRVMNWKHVHLRSGAIGLLSAFLPCGWLYSFVLLAVMAETPWEGATVLLLFWLGTLPPLILGRELYQSLVRPMIKAAPKVSGAIFISLSFLAIAIKFYPMHHHGDDHSTDQKGLVLEPMCTVDNVFEGKSSSD